jgi:hypothetical protein
MICQTGRSGVYGKSAVAAKDLLSYAKYNFAVAVHDSGCWSKHQDTRVHPRALLTLPPLRQSIESSQLLRPE